MGRRRGPKFSRCHTREVQELGSMASLISGEIVEEHGINDSIDLSLSMTGSICTDSLVELTQHTALTNDDSPLMEEGLRMPTEQRPHVSFRSPLESHRSSLLDSSSEIDTESISGNHGEYDPDNTELKNKSLRFITGMGEVLTIEGSAIVSLPKVSEALQSPVERKNENEENYEKLTIDSLEVEYRTETKKSGTGEQQLVLPFAYETDPDNRITRIEGDIASVCYGSPRQKNKVDSLSPCRTIELPPLAIPEYDKLASPRGHGMMINSSMEYIDNEDEQIDRTPKVNGQSSYGEHFAENDPIKQMGELYNSDAELARPHTLPDKAIGLGDDDSTILYERLKNEFITTSGSQNNKDIRESRCDSASDYKTAVDDYDLFSSDEEESLIIEIPNSPQTPKWSLESLSDSFGDTTLYMKYREANRYCRRDIGSDAYFHCVCTLIMLASSVCTILVIYSSINGTRKDTGCHIMGHDVSFVLNDIWDYTAATIAAVAFISVINILALTGYNIHRVRVFEVVTFLVFVGSVFINNMTLAWFENYSHELFVQLKTLTGSSGMSSIRKILICYLLYSAAFNVIVTAPTWLFRTWVLPKVFMEMVKRGSRRIKVVAVHPCTVAVPNDPVTSDTHGTIQEEGHIVTLQNVGALEGIWGILAKITKEQVIQVGPEDMAYQYVGQLNKHLKPHGYGAWKSTSPNGEVLLGYWEDGLPIGTFCTRETSCTTNFSNILLGWVTCSHGGPLSVGVAAVEVPLSIFNFTSFCRVMEYKAILLDDDNDNRGLRKCIGTAGIRKGQERQYQCHVHAGNVAMQLCKNLNDIGRYDYHQSDVHVAAAATKNTIAQKIKDLLCEMMPSKHKHRHLNLFFKCMLRTLESNVPSFATNGGTETRISVDTTSQVYVDGFVPFDVTFEHDIAPTSSKRDGKVTIRTTKAEDIPGGNTVLQTCLSRRIKDTFTVNGWKKRGYYKKPEICVFVHGAEVSTTEALQIVGKLFALWNFPQYIKPLTFGWLGCRWLQKLSPTKVESIVSHNKEAFMSFLKSLLSNGITDVHLLVDSTGTEMFLESFRDIIEQSGTDGIFRSLYYAQTADAKRINLMSVTLLFPNYNLERFIKVLYRPLRTHCNIITVFGSQQQRVWFGTGGAMEVNIKRICTDTGNTSVQDARLQHTDIDAQPTVGIVQLPVLLVRTSDESVNCHSTRVWLDVDCIDVTWLPMNRKGRRHSMPKLSWYLSREISEDLRELITTRKRARDRVERLDRTMGNIWAYRRVGLDHGSMLKEIGYPLLLPYY